MTSSPSPWKSLLEVLAKPLNKNSLREGVELSILLFACKQRRGGEEERPSETEGTHGTVRYSPQFTLPVKPYSRVKAFSFHLYPGFLRKRDLYSRAMCLPTCLPNTCSPTILGPADKDRVIATRRTSGQRKDSAAAQSNLC